MPSFEQVMGHLEWCSTLSHNILDPFDRFRLAEYKVVLAHRQAILPFASSLVVGHDEVISSYKYVLA